MDISAIGSKLIEYIRKYRYVLLVLAIGVVLMVIPTGKKQPAGNAEPVSTQPAFSDPTNELEQILSRIDGAGKVQLMLTLDAGEKIVYQTDQDNSASGDSSSVRIETVIVTDADRAEQGLTQQILAPRYRGAVVVCQGADDAAVRLAIVEAVSDATGLGSDRISVLKMK